MSVVPPPSSVWWVVEQGAPGVYQAFFNAITPFISWETRASSWWRSTWENARVGGHPDSQHLVGLAVDLVEPNLDTLYQRLRWSGLPVVREPDHVHVQAWPAGAARSSGLLAALHL